MAIPIIIKNHLRDGAIHRWVQRRKGRAALAEWEFQGRPIPPPQAYKQKVIRDTAAKYGTRVLVETGTNWGNMVAASLGTFKTIYSIELLDELYERAVLRFARHTKVKLRHGDSAVELPRILAELKEPALFWLDAHYSGAGTAQADLDTPIVSELREVSQNNVSGHVILIDDARYFDGNNDYPTIDACRALAAKLWPKYRFSVEDDIIKITPPQSD